MAINTGDNGDFVLRFTADVTAVKTGLQEIKQDADNTSKEIVNSIKKSTKSLDVFSINDSLKKVNSELREQSKITDQTIANYREMLNASSKISKSLSDVAKQTKSVDDMIKEMSKNADFSSKISKTVDKMSALKDEMRAMSSKEIKTKEFTDLEKAIDKTQATLEKLHQRQDKLQFLGVSESSRQFQGLAFDIARAEDKLASLVADKQRMEQSGTSFVYGYETSDYEKKEQQLSTLNAKIKEYYSNYQKLVNLEQKQANTPDTGHNITINRGNETREINSVDTSYVRSVERTNDEIESDTKQTYDNIESYKQTVDSRMYSSMDRQREELWNTVNNINEGFKAIGAKAEDNAYLANLSAQVDEAIQSTSVLQAKYNQLKIPGEVADEIQKDTSLSEKLKDAWNRFTLKPEKVSAESERILSKIEAVKQKMNEMETTYVPSSRFLELQKEIEKTNDKLNTLKAKEEDWKADGVKETSIRFKTLQRNISETIVKLEEYLQDFNELKESENAFVPKSVVNSGRYDKLKEQLSGLEAQYQESLNNIDTSSQGTTINIGEKLVQAFSFVVKNGVNNLKTAFKTLFNLVKTGFSAIVSKVRDFHSNLKKMRSDTNLLESAVKKVHHTFTSFLSLLKTRIKRMVISEIFKDMKEDVKNIALVSDRFNNAMSSMVGKAKVLGAQLIAAFEPVIVAIAPAVSAFLDKLTAGADRLAQFLARLTGNDTYLKATEGNYNFAESMKTSETNTKKATKAVKEYQNTVLSFDQLHKLNGNNNNGDVADEVEDLTGVSNVALNKAKTQATALNELADKIREAWRKGDFREVGKLIGKGITDAFSWLKDTAGWEKNGEKFTKFLLDFIDIVNGIADGLDPAVIGNSIGDVINTIIHGFEQLTDPNSGIDFESWGTKIGETLKNAIETIDWEDAGRAFVQGVQGMVRFFNSILETGVLSDLGTGVNDALGGGIGAINTDLWSDYISNWINGIADFIVNAFDNSDNKFDTLGEKIGKIITDSFGKIKVDKLKNAFKTLTGSIFALLKGLWKSLPISELSPADWGSMFADLLNNMFKGLEDIFSDTSKAKEVGDKISEFINSFFEDLDADQVASGINALVDSLTTAINTALSGVKWNEEVLPKLKEMATKLNWGGIAEIIGVFAAPAIIAALPSLLGEMFKLGFMAKLGIGGLGGALLGGIGLVGVIALLATNLLLWKSNIERIAELIPQAQNMINENKKRGSDDEVASKKAQEYRESVEKNGKEFADKTIAASLSLDTSNVDDKLAEKAVYYATRAQESQMPKNWFEFLGGTAKEWLSNSLVSNILSFGSPMARVNSDIAKYSPTESDVWRHLAEDTANPDTTQLQPIMMSASTAMTQVAEETRKQNEFDQQHSITADGLKEETATLAGAFSEHTTKLDASNKELQQSFMEAIQGLLNNMSEKLNGSDDKGDLVLMVDSEELARANMRGNKRIDKKQNPKVAFS